MSGGTSPRSLFLFSNQVDASYGFDQTQSPTHDMLLNALDGGKSTARACHGLCTDTLSALQEALNENRRADFICNWFKW